MVNFALRIISAEIRESIPLATILKVKKKGKNSGLTSYGIQLILSTSCNVFIELPKKSGERNAWINLLQDKQSSLRTSIWTTPNPYKPEDIPEGWTQIENKFTESYPQFFYVPPDVTPQLLEKACKFRTRNRLPMFSFQFKKDNPESNDSKDKRYPVLQRSSMPKTGLFGSASADDQQLMTLLANSHPLLIADCRSKLVGFASSIKGGGTETIDKNSDTQISFLGIPNIHAVRNALIKFQDDYVPWLEKIKLIIEETYQVCDKMEQDYSVLVHCSDGWDRTSQVSSLAQLVFFPHLRTFEGFERLLHKDWLDAGYQFATRSGQNSDQPKDQISPVFIQFLDCVFQMMNSNPTAFEFNKDFILFLGYHAYSNFYGDFLFDTCRERSTKKRPPSLFKIISADPKKKALFINSGFDPHYNGFLEMDGNLVPFEELLTPYVFGGSYEFLYL
jgi:hypothetical protein